MVTVTSAKTWRTAPIAIACAAALWMLATLSIAAPATGSEASLPQAAHRISNWAVDGNRGIWVEATGGQWYYAEFLGPCGAALNSGSLAFRFNPNGSLDRFSHILVRHPRRMCAFKSFVTSSGPPAGRHLHAAAPASK